MPGSIKVDDLTDLWRAGTIQLPLVAFQYADMAQALHRTALSQHAAFTRSIGGPSRLPDAWTSLRNLVQNEIAVRSYNNLLAAGRALANIANSYATADYLNAEQLSQYREDLAEIMNGSTDEESPPLVPSAPTSSDPHPEQQSAPVNGPL